MRRRFVFKQTMARVGSKHIGGNGKSRCWFVVPVSCAFFIVASCTFLISTLVYPKHSEMSVAVVEKPISLPSNDSVIEEPVDLPANDSTPSKIASSMSTDSPLPTVDKCSGRYVYVHDLPRRFNSDMIRGCSTLNRWTEIRWMDVCAFTTNAGLGPRLDKDGGVFAGTGWYATNQFALEVIFHNRMKQYECQTTNSSLASAIFVPYYAGLDIARYLWGYEASVRDATSRDLIRWLKSRPEWSAMGGRDHFMVAGRITWDFRRATDVNSASPDWGNKLLLLPEVKNMSVLVIEASPWNSNDFGVPYPTYFHPSKDNDVHMWQNRMRRMKRPGLFSFAGAPRPDQPASIRNAIIDQCKRSQLCRLLECGIGHSKCHSPGSVMRMFERSTFCLQPPGDSYTRRSSFDSMMAGCVPVFFHPGSAYVQYTWHLPRNYSRYSVFIPENKVREGTVRIEEVLKRYKKNEVKAMREEVIRMIPRLIYADPRARLERTRDAFDLAVDGVIERVRGIKAGKVPVFKEKENWKNAIVGSGKEYEWEHFFNNRM